jgi:copper chaperone CopZ
MKIEILYFDECPNHGPTAERVKEALQQEGLDAKVVEVYVPDDGTARSLRFLGSPTVRIDGLDIEPSARLSKEFGLMCRTYSDRGKQVGVPPLDLIRTALRQAVNRQSAAHDCCQKPTGEVVSPESSSPKGRRFLFGASVAAAIGASLCCILPILAAVTGAGAIAAGVAFEKWRPYLLGLTGLLLAGSVLFAWHDHKRACTPGGFCATKPMSRWNYVALAILAAGVIALAALPYYSGAVAQIVVRQPSPTHAASSVALSTVTFRVPDMDCPACAVALSAALDKLPGVAHAKLDVSSRQAVVTYDPATQDAAALEKVISDAGFHIAPGPGSS